VRVGINGFGRIGRNFFRAVEASDADVEIVAFNDLVDFETQAHLLKYDSVLGRFDRPVSVSDKGIRVGDTVVHSLAERDPANLPWDDLGVDVVVESTGFFTDGAKAEAHRTAGAKKVIISAPASNDDFTVVFASNFCHEVQRVRVRIEMRQDGALDAGLRGHPGDATWGEVSGYGAVVGEGTLDEEGVGAAGELHDGLAVFGVPGIHERTVSAFEAVGDALQAVLGWCPTQRATW